MKTPRILIAIAAVVLLAQATAVAQPTKFRAPHERGHTDRPALHAATTDSAAITRHQHRPGAGSPRTDRIQANSESDGNAELVNTSGTTVRHQHRPGGASPRTERLGTGEAPSHLAAALRPSAPLRTAGPPARRGGRR